MFYLIPCFVPYSMKASKIFPGAEPNLKALLSRLAVNEDKFISSFSQLFPKLVFIGKEENTFEVSRVSLTKIMVSMFLHYLMDFIAMSGDLK